MPVIIDGKDYFEDLSLTQEEFYRRLRHGVNVSTSQPAPGQLIEKWDKLLKTYHEVVYIPMSGGLSGSVKTARALASSYMTKHIIQVVGGNHYAKRTLSRGGAQGVPDSLE